MRSFLRKRPRERQCIGTPRGWLGTLMQTLRRVAGLWGRPRCQFLLMLVLNAARAHWHERWEYGALHNYPWYGQDWVHSVTDFYCDDTCEDRLMLATTIDREFKALVDIFNQTTGGPRDVYRGAFEGHNHTIAALGMAARRRPQG